MKRKSGDWRMRKARLHRAAGTRAKRKEKKRLIRKGVGREREYGSGEARREEEVAGMDGSSCNIATGQQSKVHSVSLGRVGEKA